MSEAKGRIKNMNKRDYESTNDYKKSIEILKNFVRDVLDGDIEKLRDFDFTDLTTYVGDIIDPDMYLITQAIYIILWGDLYDLTFETMGAWNWNNEHAFRGDTMNSFGSLFGKEDRKKDTGLWSTDHGKIPGSFRQSRGEVLEFDSVLAWLPIEKTEIDIKELWWNPEYRLISIIYDSIMVFAKDTDNYLTMEYYGGNEGKIIFYMDVQTGNILENDKNRKEEIYYLQSTLRAWYSDMREKLLEGYQNGKFTILPEWDEQG